MPSVFDNALLQLSRATSVQKFDEQIIEYLKHPHREIRAMIPLKMDDGSLRFVEAYRVQHNNWRGPYKGGIRFHEQTDIEEVKALAFWMTLKTAVADLPMGGGKGGATINPKQLSQPELERLSREWMRIMADVVGPDKDVPAPDVNTTPQIMAWMSDEYGKITGDTSGAVITGKPVENGGSLGRGVATALGGFYVFETLREKLGLPEKCCIAIQGFGNAGQNMAEFFARAGHIVVVASDSKGTVFNEKGLNITELSKYKKLTGSVLNFSSAQNIESSVLEAECDLLIPAALENQITAENADRIKAKAILELANGPTTPEADDILFEKGIKVVPDILANSGGVTVSVYEWEQNKKGEHWTETDVFARLKQNIQHQAYLIERKAEELKTDMRRAAFIVALERLAQAKK